jgi:hypothetical protein
MNHNFRTKKYINIFYLRKMSKYDRLYCVYVIQYLLGDITMTFYTDKKIENLLTVNFLIIEKGWGNEFI